MLPQKRRTGEESLKGSKLNTNLEAAKFFFSVNNELSSVNHTHTHTGRIKKKENFTETGELENNNDNKKQRFFESDKS